jgi:hypothetical protein
MLVADFSVKAFVAKPDRKIIQFNVTLLKPAKEMYAIEITTVNNGSDEYCRHLSGCSKYIQEVGSKFWIFDYCLKTLIARSYC